MLHACLALIRWAGKQELITEKESAKAEAGVGEMMKHLWP
jgi:hypothetical protein